jgi:hypothetical protein
MEERDELIVNAAKAEAEKHLGKLADDEQFVVIVNSWNIEITVAKKPEPIPVIDTAPASMTPQNAPF